MIKGCQRKMIVLSGNESSLFESAYFILKKGIESESPSHADMVREANRIVERCLPGNLARIKRRKKLRRIFCETAIFLCGILLGGGGFWAANILFSFAT